VSEEREIRSGSAARQHERTGGNVRAGQTNVPAGGDAARKAEGEGDAVNEAHGIRVAPRGANRGLAVNLRSAAGARLVDAEPEKNWSARKASDYLPPQLKAELVAAGRMLEDGRMVSATPVGGAPARPSEEDPTLPAATVAASNQVPESRGAWQTITGFFRKMFT
jgi:hypothetical protein